MSEERNNVMMELDWDSEIEYIESQYTLLPDGKYPFTVKNFDRQRWDGSAKIPACKMAVLHMSVDGGSLGIANVDERMYLHSSMMWKLSEFFTSIGMLQEGGRVKMDWNAVPGATGVVEIEVNKYKDKNGNDKTNNKVKKFLPKGQASDAAQAPSQAPATPAWTGGKFS